MERENFYILLDLSLDPPETNPEVIKERIKKKKAEWSKQRNHPTKGLQAQKNISLIPEIEKVMLDPQLRAEELEAAKGEIKKGKESKYPEIDRHIDILMGKGFIAPEEITKLAGVHGLPENEIQDRINNKKQQKYGHIDRAISLRMDKGYVTEAEILKIAKRYSLSEQDVRKRVRCPIKKDDKEKEEDAKPRHIDKSLEKTINDNLKILGKASLYDFLDLPESADLESLQSQAGRKKKELANISKKDAMVTAGNTLAGHCMTIFKTDESRNAYDISLARSRLASLDSDIDIAAVNGKVRFEYYDILIQKAMEFGMDQEEADSYISGYCSRKGYKIDRGVHKRKRRLIIGGGLAAAVVLLTVAGLIFSSAHQKQARESEFKKMMAKVRQQQNPDSKRQILKNYLNTHQNSKYANSAKKEIKKIRAQEKKQKYSAVMDKADGFRQAEDYEKAARVYQQFIDNNPESPYIDKAKKQMAKMGTLAEARDYQKLKNIAINGGPDEKIQAARAYLNAHPNGKHKARVSQLIDDMSNEYFIFVKNRLDAYKKQKRWKECIELCNTYIELYDNSHTDQLKQILPKYEKHYKDEQLFARLKKKASAQGEDYQSAKRLYKDYLEAYPDTTVRREIEKEMARLDRQIEQKRIADAKGDIRAKLGSADDRFIEKTEGVVLDKETGLMWTLVDSSIPRPDECFTYEKAQEYTKNLNAGGYSDWRLPTPKELAGIYKNKPFFPANASRWYWTSENYSSYSNGWHKIVDTVTGKNQTDWEIVRKDATACGTVRAVREAK